MRISNYCAQRGMPDLNFFGSLKYLEPKCPKCGSLIDWGVSTEYNEEDEVHVCKACGTVLK